MNDTQPDHSPADELRQLMAARWENRLSKAQGRRLEAIVVADRELCRQYIAMIELHAHLHSFASVLSDRKPMLDDSGEYLYPLHLQDIAPQADLSDAMILPAIQDLPVEEEEVNWSGPPVPAPDQPRSGWNWRGVAAAAAAAMVVGATILLGTRHSDRDSVIVAASKTQAVPADPTIKDPPTRNAQATGEANATPGSPQTPATVARKPVAATLVRALDAKWGDGVVPAAGAPLATGRAHILTSGFAQIQFERGTTVIVEAPARFELLSDASMQLIYGKVAATVPPPARGFAVLTSVATFTDLGTEFGIDASVPEKSRLEVFRGRVSVQPRLPCAAATTLQSGQAAQVSSLDVLMLTEGAIPQRFLRTLPAVQPATLDVADIICGGDGATSRRGKGIDPTTGDFGDLKGALGRHAERSYFRVPGLPAIDGCFVPNGQTQIDSAGHVFTFAAKGGETFGHIWAGAGEPWQSEGDAATKFNARLGGIDYGAGVHNWVSMHASKGLTLDLEAIRRLHPDASLKAFVMTAGNNAPEKAQTDLFVFVDGELQFQRQGFASADGAFEVRIPIADSTRFLTICSAAQPVVRYAWVLLGDPRFELGVKAVQPHS